MYFDRSALMVGSPETVAAKIRQVDSDLGGISRLSVLLDGGSVPHEHVMRSIELLGQRVRPLVQPLAVR